MIKIVNFEVLRLTTPERPIILIYALGEDGILYEMSGGRWISFPIGDHVPTIETVQAEQRALQAQQEELPSRIIKPKRHNSDDD